MNHRITVENVSYYYPTRRNIFNWKNNREKLVFDDLNFSILNGETFGVIGSNGVGKSTLLKLLGGILIPQKGKIDRAGTACLLSLGTGFDPNLSGYDNILVGGLLLGHTLKEIKSLIDEIVEFSELGSSIQSPLRTYSAGMRSRLSFSVAVSFSPEILLIDEILAVGDASFRAKSKNLMNKRIKGDTTVVLVSHNENDIESVCDRCLWLDQGKIKAIGTPDKVLPLYKNHSKG